MNAEIAAKRTAVIKASVTTLLVKEGFRKVGRVYVRPVDSVVWLVDVQQSRWNSAEEVSFTLNCGMYLPGFETLYAGIQCTGQPKVVDCCVSARGGFLSGSKTDLWWQITAETSPADLDNIVEEIGHVISEGILPFLARFQSLDDIVDYLEAPRPYAERNVWPNESVTQTYLAILYAMRGQIDQALLTLERLDREAINPNFATVIAVIRERLLQASR